VKLKYVTLLFLLQSIAFASDDAGEILQNGALGAGFGFVSQGYVGAIFGGLGGIGSTILDTNKVASPNVYLTTFKGPYPKAYRIDKYRVLNPYDGKEVWVGTYNKDGTYFRDTEGRLFEIASMKK